MRMEGLSASGVSSEKIVSLIHHQGLLHPKDTFQFLLKGSFARVE